MKSFAQYLKQYLTDKNISYSTAAKMCKIDRTILGRFANGTRKPQGTEIITKLSDGLQMSQQESQKLYEAYRRSKISEECNTDYAILSSIVNDKHLVRKKMGNTASASGHVFMENMYYELYGQEDICNAINYVKSHAEYIKMNFSPHQFEQNEDFRDVFANIQEISRREQIICLENRDWQCGEERMRNLNCLLPYLLQEEKTSVYYYCKRQEKYDSSELKKYYLITNKGMVFFNQKLTRGFMSSQKVPCQYYMEQFDKMKLQCRVFAEGGLEKIEMSDMQSKDKLYINENSGIVFYGQEKSGYIWVMRKGNASVACIQEPGSAILLWKFLWDSDGKIL